MECMAVLEFPDRGDADDPTSEKTQEAAEQSALAAFDAMVAERGEALARIDAHVEAAENLVAGMSPQDRRRTLMHARVDDDGVLRGPRLRPVRDRD